MNVMNVDALLEEIQRAKSDLQLLRIRYERQGRALELATLEIFVLQDDVRLEKEKLMQLDLFSA